jgi:hypothetical protein
MRRMITLICLALLGSCSPAYEDSADRDNAAAAASARVDVGDLVYCVHVEQEVTPRDCELAALADEQAAEGLATLKYSKFMTVGDVSSVSMVIDRRSPSNEAPAPSDSTVVGERSVAQEGPDPVEHAEPPTPPAASEREPNVTVTYHPIVGRFTSARLEGVDFDISPREAVTKEIPRGGQEGWNWSLTPLREGKLTFLVITNVQFKRSDGTYMALAQKAEPYEVTVGVGFLSRVRVFLEELPDWIGYLTAVLTALTALFAAWFGFRLVLRRRAGEPAGGENPPSEEN